MNLITWNIQWGRGVDGRVDFKRVVDHACAMADFDVLCLQEVGRNYPGLAGSVGEDQFAALAGLLPGYRCVEGVATDTAAEDGARRQFGNAIFTGCRCCRCSVICCRGRRTRRFPACSASRSKSRCRPRRNCCGSRLPTLNIILRGSARPRSGACASCTPKPGGACR
ncbi:MAG: hypothetical protein WDN04_17815 [Rhodospirillales bacterium]